MCFAWFSVFPIILKECVFFFKSTNILRSICTHQLFYLTHQLIEEFTEIRAFEMNSVEIVECIWCSLLFTFHNRRWWFNISKVSSIYAKNQQWTNLQFLHVSMNWQNLVLLMCWHIYEVYLLPLKRRQTEEARARGVEIEKESNRREEIYMECNCM